MYFNTILLYVLCIIACVLKYTGREGRLESPACPLCLKRGTLEHILSSCSRALGEGCYRWGHDPVPKAIADIICSGISRVPSVSLRPVKKTIALVRAGEKPTPAARATSSGLLAVSGTKDWELKVNPGKRLKFSENAAASTTLRPNMVLISEASEQIVPRELTVPWEDRIEEANEKKRQNMLS